MALTLSSDDNAIIKELKNKGIILKAPINIQGSIKLEPPCCLSIMGGVYVMKNFSMGAFSYISGNFSSVYSIEIGRYCSFGMKISSKGDHPMHYFTMSPIFFNPKNPFPHELVRARPEDFKSKLPRSLKKNLDISIGNDVWIGDDVFLKPGISVGDGSVIGAKAVVTKDVPPYAIVAGVPAKIIRYRFDDKIIEELLEIKWWEFAHWQLKGVKLDNIEEFIDFVKDLRRNEKPYRPEKVEL